MQNHIEQIAENLRKIQTEPAGDSDNHVVFIAEPSKNIYIQFAATSEGAPGAHTLYAEAVSNEFLPPDRQLSKERMLALKLSGWSEPKHVPNFSRTWTASSDADWTAIAQEVVCLFREVYGVTSFKNLVVDLRLG